MKIYTITLNPAYDIHAHTERFVPFHENLAHIRSREAGGKGLNISRALNAGQIPNTAVIVLGTDNGADYKQYLFETGMDCLLFENTGRIRENLTLHCADASETRISFSGFHLDVTVLTQILETLAVDEQTIVTFTGRVPDGISMEQTKDFLKSLQKKGAKIVLDSRSFTLEDMYDVQPWLIKPNQEEISAFFGCSVEHIPDAAIKASEIAAHGIPNVMISLGHLGALLASEGVIFHAIPPEIDVHSTIGAGDSTIAGFIVAAAQRYSPAQCLQTAVAFGSAACLTEGSQPPQSHEIDQIYQQIKVTILSQCNFGQ